MDALSDSGSGSSSEDIGSKDSSVPSFKEVFSRQKPTVSADEISDDNYIERPKKIIARSASERITTGIGGIRVRNYVSDEFLISRCCKFSEKNLYMDLPGKFIEHHFNRRLNDSDLSNIFCYLRANSDIIYLNLSYNSITSNGFSFIAHFLASNRSIKGLNLMHNDITRLDEVVMRKTVPLWRLKCLVLSGNKLGKHGGIELAHILRLNTSIIHLEIGETDQTIQSVAMVIESLLSYLGGNTTLKKLDLTRIIPSAYKRLDSSHFCRLFAAVLYHNPSLVEIHLAKNEIGDPDLELMAGGLKKNGVIELLNLTANRLTSYGMEILADLLPQTNIRCLLVASNHIGSDGAVALGRVFSRTKLRSLDISNNQIRTIGFSNLLWGMKSHKTPIQSFFFYGNPLDNETLQLLQVQIHLKHIAPTSIDVQFVWKDKRLVMVEDVTANKYRSVRYLVHDLSNNMRPVPHHCCY